MHSFTELHDGSGPGAGLVFDTSGNLFGSADFGGNGNLGTIWELSPTAHGPWKLTQLYSFGNGATGGRPNAGVIIDPSGNLYGTAQQDGEFDRGSVFELSPPDSKNIRLVRTADSDARWLTRVEPAKREILFDFAQVRLYATPEKRLRSG